MSYRPVGAVERRPVPEVFRRRWLYFAMLFAAFVGNGIAMTLYGAVPWWFGVAVVAVSAVALGTSAGKVSAARELGEKSWRLCDNVYGPVTDQGATVYIRPSPHPEVPGEIIVVYPGGDEDDD